MNISIKTKENSLFIISAKDDRGILEPLGFDFQLLKEEEVEIRFFPLSLMEEVEIQFQSNNLYIHIPFPYDRVDILRHGNIIDTV
jgi:hypothetical protein